MDPYLITNARALQAQVLLHREVDRDHEEAVIEFRGIYLCGLIPAFLEDQDD